MFNLGIQELILIAIIALIFVGPKNLPELAKGAGKFFRDLKRAANDVTNSFEKEVSELNAEAEKTKSEIKEDLEVKLIAEDSTVAQNEKPRSNS